MEEYKNVLANKFMRDTNFIIIKDTDDLEELERQWELFSSYLTPRQQRLSDDRSIEIWDMTNQQHYESIKSKLMKDLSDEYDDLENDNFEKEESYDDLDVDTDEEDFNSDDMFSILNDENEFVEETSNDIPINKTEEKPKSMVSFDSLYDADKDNAAKQWEINSNLNMIGYIQKPDNFTDLKQYMDNLEKKYVNFKSQTAHKQRKADDKCIQIYGMTNEDRYKSLKSKIHELEVEYKYENDKKEEITADEIKNKIGIEDKAIQEMGGFVLERYNNRQIINEQETKEKQQHRRLNDTPYFTPTELIDLGVHGNNNYYSKQADNDGLITKVKTPTWFDSYKDMCMDHIFEDYRKDWIDTMDYLYSDFEDIKQSGDEEKILSRKQSILDLGWNPEIPFNRKNRLKASRRVSDILDRTIPKDIFINLNDINDIEDGDQLMEERVNSNTHEPVLLIFTQGKTPILSKGIKLVTKSEYSHASISFDPTLEDVYSYNMKDGANGFVRENRKSFKDNVISVMAFFAPNAIVQALKDKIKDFENNNGSFDLKIFFNKIMHINHKTSNNEYKQVCSTFVDTVLKSGNINLVGDSQIPSPAELYNGAKSIPNKIIEVFFGNVQEYNANQVSKKLKFLSSEGKVNSIEESLDYNTDKSSNTISIFNEVKKFPIEFDKEGNLIIYKCRNGRIEYGDEIHDSVELLELYRNTNNVEGMKYELAKLWFLNDSIEKRLKKRLSNDEYKQLIDDRSTCINVFKTNLEYVMKSEKGFNFSDYYNSTPFSDNSIKITANTLKYSMKSIISAAGL